MKTLLTVIQLISGVLLILTILIQNRGTGLSATFGGSDTFFSVKRGAEKVVAIATIIFATLFLVSSIIVSLVA